ncbi:MAG: hypothetical protein ACRDFS_07265 [Chloroflexota bacterium]
MSAPDTSTAAAGVRHALNLLGRASIEWQNGDPRVPGPLHWRMAVMVAQRELRQALEALDRHVQHGGVPPEPRCLHCGGAGFEEDAVCESCSGTGRDQHLEDALRGSIWWNSISRTERRYWLEAANSADPAAAWDAYKAGGRQP